MSVLLALAPAKLYLHYCNGVLATRQEPGQNWGTRTGQLGKQLRMLVTCPKIQKPKSLYVTTQQVYDFFIEAPLIN